MGSQAVLGFCLLLSSFLPAQQRAVEGTLSPVDHLVRIHHDAVWIFRNGDTARALALLGDMRADEQKKAIAAIEEDVAAASRGGLRRPGRPEWTPTLLRALGALHMEAAVTVLRSDDEDVDETAVHHIALARIAFGALTIAGKRNDRSFERWLLVPVLRELGDGQFSRGAALVKPFCNNDTDYAPLLIACGTVHETLALLPADAVQLRQLPQPNVATAADVRRGSLLPQTGIGPRLHYAAITANVRRISRAVAVRREQLAHARRYFEAALALEPGDLEASVRLANVRTAQGEYDAAAQLLEPLLIQPRVPWREACLTRLFLARVRTHQKRLEEAAAILAKLDPVQSALLALAHNALQRGNSTEAVTYAERASRTNLEDPWWGYSYAQYWVPDPLHKQLLAEARK